MVFSSLECFLPCGSRGVGDAGVRDAERETRGGGDDSEPELTSLQTLVMGPELALGSLQTLAALQSTTRSDAHDAEPGKIVHEVRVGRVAAEGGSFPYYGSVDSTLLFLILLSEVYRWTGDPEPVQRLRPNAMAALRWMREEADLLGETGVVAHDEVSRVRWASRHWISSRRWPRSNSGPLARTTRKVMPLAR